MAIWFNCLFIFNGIYELIKVETWLDEFINLITFFYLFDSVTF